MPTRTLTQIRTHAQKFFLKHGMPDKTQPEGNITSGEFTTSSGITMRPVATLRHVLLEPLHPLVSCLRCVLRLMQLAAAT